MDPIVDLAPGADDNPLAARFADRIRERVRDRPRQARIFRALRGAVLLVAKDTGTALTMRFDHGRLTLHDGTIGIPTVTFLADEAVLLGLGEIPLTRWLGLPIPTGAASRAAWRRWVGRLVGDDLTIYGLLAHPRMVLRVLGLLSDR